MTNQEANAIRNAWLEQIHATLSPYAQNLPQEDQDELVRTMLLERTKLEMERNPEFRNAMVRQGADAMVGLFIEKDAMIETIDPVARKFNVRLGRACGAD
jgi:hypothetical protein